MAMHTTLRIVTPPVSEPVTPASVRQHCRIDAVDDDELLADYIATARELSENFLNRALIQQTLLWTVKPLNSAYPNYRAAHSLPWGPFLGLGMTGLTATFELPRPPAQSVTSVVIRDNLGVDYAITTAIDPTTGLPGYEVDLQLEPARLHIEAQALNTLLQNNPAIQPPIEHLQVQLVTGSPLDTSGNPVVPIPRTILTAIRMEAAWLYEHRGDVDVEDGLSKVVESLLWNYRVATFGGP